MHVLLNILWYNKLDFVQHLENVSVMRGTATSLNNEQLGSLWYERSIYMNFY